MAYKLQEFTKHLLTEAGSRKQRAEMTNVTEYVSQ